MENNKILNIKEHIKGTEFEGKVYIAGGYVRDELMGLNLNEGIKDIDLMIDMYNGGIIFAEWFCKKLNIYRHKYNPVIYPRFGTAKFNFNSYLDPINIECVMPRKEKYIDGSRKPDVINGTLYDDVRRRDFTINSLLKNISTGEILDLTGMGINDIKNGIVRTPLDPDIIFSEDPLRMLRAIRFAVKYSWKLPMFMIKSIKKNSKKINEISKERISDELNKMLITDNPDVAIRLLQITSLSKYIFPQLDKLIGLKQNKFHDFDAMKHTLLVLKRTPKDLITRLAALFHDIGKYKTKTEVDGNVHFYNHESLGAEIAKDILKHLKYSNEIISGVFILINNHMRTKPFSDDTKVSDKVLRKLCLDLGIFLNQTLDLIHADNLSHNKNYEMINQIPTIKDRIKNLKEIPISQHIKLPINGDDIMEHFSIKPGPIIKQLLLSVEDKWLENPDLTREESLEIIEKKYSDLIK